jgi:hypothetical protein
LAQPCLKAGASLFELVEHVIKRSQARAAFGGMVTDLLNDLTLLSSDCFQFL